MAIARTGPIVSLTSGALGGLVFVASKKGQVIRPRPLLKTRASAANLRVRSIHARALIAWRAMTDTQRRAWYTAATSTSSTNRLGVPRPISAIQLYLSITIPAIATGLTPVSIPPVPLSFSPFGSMPYTCTSAAFTLTPTLLSGTPFGTIAIRGARSLRSAASLPQPRVFQHYTSVGYFAWGGAALDLFAAFNSALGPLGTREWWSLIIVYVHSNRAVSPAYTLYGNRSN